MHLIVHTMQGQTQDSKELENSPSGRVSQCIEPRSIQLSQACCASHSGRLSPLSSTESTDKHRRSWMLALRNTQRRHLLESLRPSFHLFLRVGILSHLPQLQLRICNMSLATGHTNAETCLECLTFQASLKRRESKKL